MCKVDSLLRSLLCLLDSLLRSCGIGAVRGAVRGIGAVLGLLPWPR